jgi:hypothetical protein
MINRRKHPHDPSKRSIARWENEGGATKNRRGKGPLSADSQQWFKNSRAVQPKKEARGTLGLRKRIN